MKRHLHTLKRFWHTDKQVSCTCGWNWKIPENAGEWTKNQQAYSAFNLHLAQVGQAR